MTLKDLQSIPAFMTRAIAAARDASTETRDYIATCMLAFYSGDYGPEIGAEDTAANNSDLRNGCGHVLARYPKRYALEDDIYIETHFDVDHLDNIDYTITMIMYITER